MKYKFDVEPESPDMLHGDMLKPFTVFLVNGGRLGMQRGNRIEYKSTKGKSVFINMDTGALCKNGKDQYTLFLRTYLRRGFEFIKDLNKQADAKIAAGSQCFVVRVKRVAA